MFSDAGRIVACAVCTTAILSCTVKEDRTECPCFLTLDLGGIESAGLMDEGMDSLVVCVRSSDDMYVREAFHLRDNVQEYSIAVPKERTEVMVACHGGGFIPDRYGIHIPEGSQSPALYLSCDSFVAETGEMRRTVSLHRNYCILTVSMKTSSGAVARPYSVQMEGNVSGYLMDGTPEEGRFHSFLPSTPGVPCHLRIPRQRDGSLMLELDFPDSGEVRSFPVGEYILDSGYDWNAPDLEDIDVEMDFSRSSITFTISKWKKTLSFEITF